VPTEVIIVRWLTSFQVQLLYFINIFSPVFNYVQADFIYLFVIFVFVAIQLNACYQISVCNMPDNHS